jgi:hypothetical protein
MVEQDITELHGGKIMLRMRITSSLEKCFYDQSTTDKPILSEISLLKNERYSFQICYDDPDPISHSRSLKLTVESPLVDHMKIYTVGNVPSTMPIFNNNCDGYYERTTPGLFPDYLQPFDWKNDWFCADNTLRAMWIELEPNGEFEGGVYPIRFTVTRRDHPEFQPVVLEAEAEIINAELPEQELIYTQWFYTDCLAVHYGVRPFSEKHWRIVESFLRTATKNGVNMILTPVFTPELDTYIGGERPTTQLLDITVTGKNQYEFGFDKLDRWIDLCHSVGVQYFEIPHFFTQWGAKHAPKFVGTVNGRKKKIFGWHTDACGEEYNEFLKQMIPALVAHLEKRGVAENTYFHISDEPRLKDMEQYLRCINTIEPLIKSYPIIDALSNYEFYESGAAKKPIPGICHIQPFLDNHVPDLWAYYCGNGGTNVSSRMLAMPLSRTRILGVQLWLHHIVGFLHWGYNFYYNENSYDYLNPFLHTDGEYFESSGDTFVVYPGDDGTAWESIRLNALREAMEDMRLLQLCETRIGRDATEAIVHETAGSKVTFTEYPRETNYLYELRDRLIAAIEQA